MLDVFPLRKKKLHLFTASGEEKNVVERECSFDLFLIGKDGRKFSFTASFLVVSDKMNITHQILGMPFLKLQGCQSDWEIDYMSARLTDQEGQLRRITLLQYIGTGNVPAVSKINSYENIFQTPVSCFSISDFTHCVEEEGLGGQNTKEDSGPLPPTVLPEEEVLRSETDAALTLGGVERRSPWRSGRSSMNRSIGKLT